MGIKISELPSTSIANANDVFIINQGGATKKITKDDLQNQIENPELEERVTQIELDTGTSIELSMNTSTYVLTANLKNKDDTVVSTATVDLPLESLVKDIQYDSTTKEIVFILQDGTTRRIPLSDLISGLQTEITTQNKLSSDLVDDTNKTHKFVTASEKTSWNAKYNKPNTGIPKADLANDVQTSLNKADTAIQEHQDISGKEDKSNKTTELTNESTDTQYPSAKAVYDSQAEQDTEIEELQTKVTNLEETVNSELEDGVATGTEITVNDSATADASLFPNGNTSQNQYEGRNQFNKSNIANVGANLVTELDTGERISVGGSATTSAFFSVWAVLDLTNHVGKTIRAKIKMQASGNNKGRYYLGLGNSTGGNRTMQVESSTSDNTISFIVPELGENQNYLILALYGNYNGSASANDYIDYEDVIITINNENLDYEPYVGGQASPNPTYKQDVHVLKGSNTITISNSDSTKQQVKTLTLPTGLEMCNKADYRDEFVKNLSTNKWYKNKKVFKTKLLSSNVYTGTNPTQEDAEKNAIRFRVSDTVSNVAVNNTGYSNYFIVQAEANRNGISIYSTNANIYVWISKDIADTIDKFKQFLDEHEVFLYYPLATPVLEEISDTTLIAELDELLEIRTYYGQTNITVEAEDAKPFMTLNYKKSNRILRSEIDTIKARLDLLEN